MTRIATAARDPALWGIIAAAGCGYGDVPAWAIVPLTLALTTLAMPFGSNLVWRLMPPARRLSRVEHILLTLVGSFCLIDLAYVVGDLMQHSILWRVT